MNVLARARALSGLGFSVIPVSGKVPCIKWEPFQSTRPSDDNLAGWFGTGSPRNIGIVTGQISNLVVVDTDSPAAEAWAASHLPDTRCSA